MIKFYKHFPFCHPEAQPRIYGAGRGILSQVALLRRRALRKQGPRALNVVVNRLRLAFAKHKA